MPETAIQTRLRAMIDPDYRAFQQSLMPTVNPSRVLGVRTPAVRALAKELTGSPEAETFLRALPHRYYEEDNLHAFLIEQIREYAPCVAALDAFLPCVDNWATCDSMSPRVFARHLPELYAHIPVWLASGQTYTTRYGLGMLQRWFLDDAFSPDCLRLAADVQSDEYYVNKMLAWLFATALAKQWDTAVPYLEQRLLSPWVHHAAIRKAIESRRIPDARKMYLRSLNGNA